MPFSTILIVKNLEFERKTIEISSERSNVRLIVASREYRMIYRWPVFLVVVWLDSSPTPLPPLPSVSSTSDTQEDWKRETTSWHERGGEGYGRGAKSYDRKIAWSVINHSILSACKACVYFIHSTSPVIVNFSLSIIPELIVACWQSIIVVDVLCRLSGVDCCVLLLITSLSSFHYPWILSAVCQLSYSRFIAVVHWSWLSSVVCCLTCMLSWFFVIVSAQLWTKDSEYSFYIVLNHMTTNFGNSETDL